MAKKTPAPPPEPPKKKGLIARLAAAADKQELKRAQAEGRKRGQSNKAEGKDHGPQEDPKKQMARAHQTFLIDENYRQFAFSNCYCRVYDSNHLRGG